MGKKLEIAIERLDALISSGSVTLFDLKRLSEDLKKLNEKEEKESPDDEKNCSDYYPIIMIGMDKMKKNGKKIK